MIGRRTRRVPVRGPRSSVTLGILGALVLLAAAALTFTKRVPFTHGHRLNAVVSSSAGLRKGSPVRIAGVDVGRVVGFGRAPGTTRVVEMELQDRGLPVHRDAAIRIRPRLFLEGGYYVELAPGSPSGPELPEDGTLPLGQTRIPVQFDQVLGTLDVPGRTSLKQIIGELDEGLQDGGAQALGAAARPLGAALRDGAIVSRAARGTAPGDLGRTITGAARVTRALASRAPELGGALDATATTAAALAAEDAGLRASLRGLDGLVQEAPAELRGIAGVTPQAARLLQEARPGLRRARTSVPGVVRTLAALQRAARPGELPGLLADLRPTLAEVPVLADRLGTLFGRVTPVTDCVRDRATPVLEAKLQDGALTTGRPVWQETAGALPGLAGASGSFDANGAWVRYNPGVGEQSISTGRVPGLGTTLVGTSSQPVLGSRPTYLGSGKTPPFRPDVPCTSSPPPDLTARTGGGQAMATTGRARRVTTSPAALRKLLAGPALAATPRSGR